MSEEKDKNSKKSGKANPFLAIMGLVVFVVLMIVVCGGVPLLFSTYFQEDTREIEGEASHYDPIAAFDTVSDYAGENAELTSLEAYYVRSDGTMDLNAEYYPRVDYDFYRVVSETDGNEVPLGAPNSTADAEVLYQAVSISVWKPYQMRGVSTSNNYSYMHLGMEREIDEPVRNRPAEAIPAPVCTFAELWATAIEKADAPAEAVAVIQYNAEGYYFYINDTDVRVYFDFDCNRTLRR
jgi:hypothetical protein